MSEGSQISCATHVFAGFSPVTPNSILVQRSLSAVAQMSIPYYALSRRAQAALHAKRKRASAEEARRVAALGAPLAIVRRPVGTNRLKLVDDADIPRPDDFIPIPEGTALKAFTLKTEADYTRDIAWLKHWSGVERALEINRDWFLALMLSLAPVYSKGRLEHFRAALAHFLKAESRVNNEIWTEHLGFCRDFNGITAQCRPPAVVGAISATKLTMVISMICEVVANAADHVMFIAGIRIAFNFLLRHSELLRLRFCDAEFIERLDSVSLTIIGPKGHATSNHGAPSIFYARVPETGSFFRALGKPEAADQGMFSKWNKNLINEIIMRTATRHGWDPTMRWSFHSLRHGGAQDLKERGVALSDRMTRGRWSSATVAEHYARPDIPGVELRMAQLGILDIV